MNIPPLPEGFKLENSTAQQTDIPPLPDGFELGDTNKVIHNETSVIPTTDTVASTENNSTPNVSMDMTNSDTMTTNPQYLTDTQKKYIDLGRLEKGQEVANDQGFATVRLTNGPKLLTEAPLEDTSMDIAMGLPIGKLSIFNPLPSNIKSRLLTKTAEEELPKETKLLMALNQGRQSYEEVAKALKHIPKKDRTIALADSLDLAKNYFKAGVGYDSRLATKLGARLEARKNVFKPFIADEEEVAKAKQTFSNMKENVDNVSKGAFDTSKIQSMLDNKLLDSYATDPSGIGSTLKRIKLNTSEPITAGQALDIREDINDILRKPAVQKSFKTRIALRYVKKSIDNFIRTTLPPEELTKVKQTISGYRETINRKKFGDILYNNTKSDYAVDWGKVLTDVKKEHLGGKNIDFVVPILKEFETKFHNDKNLANVITIAGKSKNLSWLGAFSMVIGKTYDILSPLVNRSRYKDILIRKAIVKAIKRGDTQSPLKFVDDLVKNKTMSIEQVQQLKQEIPEAFKTLEYKPTAKVTGDVNLKPKYVTQVGTISNDASEAALYDAQTKLVRDSLSNDYSNDVVNKVSTLLNNKRFNSIMKSTSDRMKADDIQGNMKMLQKTIKSETDKMVSRINKDHGVKLPAKEVDKLYRRKIDAMLKDCN